MVGKINLPELMSSILGYPYTVTGFLLTLVNWEHKLSSRLAVPLVGNMTRSQGVKGFGIAGYVWSVGDQLLRLNIPPLPKQPKFGRYIRCIKKPWRRQRQGREKFTMRKKKSCFLSYILVLILPCVTETSKSRKMLLS